MAIKKGWRIIFFLLFLSIPLILGIALFVYPIRVLLRLLVFEIGVAKTVAQKLPLPCIYGKIFNQISVIKGRRLGGKTC